MSELENQNKLLGKKREQKENDSEEDDSNDVSKKKQKTEQKSKQKEKDVDDSSSDSSSSSSESQPKQSLFSGNEKGFTGGLFGDLDNPQKPTSLFGNSENNQPSTSLFSNTGGSLFGNLGEEKAQGGGLFGTGLFDFSQVNKKKEEEEENEEDDNIGKSNSPKHEYNPEEDNKEDKDGYIKRYIKKLDNALLYDKNRKSYVSKGEGFIIIETQEKEKEDKTKERFARILYRNNIGGIIFQGVLNAQIHKCTTYEKKLKHICHFIFLEKGDDEKNPLVLGQAKIPFSTLDDINIFSDIYNNTIKYIQNEIDDFPEIKNNDICPK